MGIYDNDFEDDEQNSFVEPKQKNKQLSLKKKVIKKKKKETNGLVKDTTKKPNKVLLDSNKKTESRIVVEKQHTLTPEEFFSSIKPKPEYVKHLLECRCFLPQFINLPNPITHKFVVFSELDSNGSVKPSNAQCNNCGLIHRILEVETSTIIGKESMMSLPTIDDIKTSLPGWLVVILEKYQCTDLHIWQEAKFILENELWGRFIVLVKDKDKNMVNGKILQILGKELYKIEIFERDDGDAKPE